MKKSRPVLGQTQILAALFAAAVVMSGCGQQAGQIPADTVFEIDLEKVGPIYENELLGIKYRPPVNWDRLEGSQRQSVLDALALQIEDGSYTLEVADVFFDTGTMSFSSIGLVAGTGDESDAAAYITAFSETLGLTESEPTDDPNAIVTRVNFAVNTVSVVQFRHLQSNRVSFTLLFPSSQGELIQLDYSIPTENYQGEAGKLESSIGTIQSL